ncbi:TetR family transcriptional regulator [Nonomuraea phyllanthi]|uniref:TetR/AcrR family transcriptional regulator n=1 Tax=Nonomuraea phyllanthi TaxID=2219224 RepID=UPI001293D9C0|nr:TetR/AcrR family transcriptional regulator [Nonomuraea phyllanthi]QFY07363.1 TetR family transcriptional regulator [Nonomuraea phyllanthi]
MLAAAGELFATHGYASTTMQAIAKQAGVAVQTLYFTFATKRAILKELLDVEIAGDTAPVATLDRPWVAQALAAPAHEQIRLLVSATAQIMARVSPILEAVRSAAPVDPEIAELWRTNIHQRRTVLATFAGALAAKTPFRAGIDVLQATDIMLAVLAPEVYHLLIKERHWSEERWESWAVDALTRQLLPDPGTG